MSRSRNWIFTWNNYPNDWKEKLEAIPARYLVAGQEEAPTTGTKHLQGAVFFNNPRTLAGVRRLLHGCHIEQMRGTPAQAIAYAKKEGEWKEWGVEPATSEAKGTQEKERWANALTLAKENRLEEIQESDPDIYIRYYNALCRIASDNMPKVRNLESVCGLWIWGPSGCGKSTMARSLFPDSYPKPLNKWWDGYRDEESVIIDDIDPSHANWVGYFLKIWSDRFAFIAEIKGRSRKIRPRAIVVTSQYSISQIWNDQETREALSRRFQCFQFSRLAVPNFTLINFEN